MSTAIHIELNALCLVLLCTIVYQSRKNVNQQMSRILLRTTAYGIIVQLILDISWTLVEGRIFPGSIPLNGIINAFYLAIGVCLGCTWYLYVLETMGFRITARLKTIVMIPGIIFTVLNLISLWTGWIFSISPDNVYVRGPLFWLQSIGAYGMILISLLHIIFRLINRRDNRASHRDVLHLFKFYIVTVVGSVPSMFFTGMPGTWTSAAVSIVLIYLDDQNREILHGMITAMAADYKSLYYVDLDKDECTCVQAAAKLSRYMWENKVFSFYDGFVKYARQFVCETDRDAFISFIQPVNIRSGLANEPMITHRYLVNKDGMEQYEMISIASISTVYEMDGSAGKIRSIGLGFSNIDRETREELKQKHALAEALTKAEEANAAKTAFLSSMSHEIRTPMNAIIGLNNIALRDPSISPATRDELEKIGSSAHHLLSLINDILDMSRIESGRMVLKSEEFSLHDMTKQINTIINGQCKDKGLTYVNQLDGCAEEYFIGDDLRLRQIIINILGNAVKFTDPPGTVTFTVEQIDFSCNRDKDTIDGKSSSVNDGCFYGSDAVENNNSENEGSLNKVESDRRVLRFTMKDTGIGMDEAFLPHLFEPFAQEDDTSTNRYGGSGLGMALTKNMVDLMGGMIVVKSKKRLGTTFIVDVPLQVAHHVFTDETTADLAQQLEEEVSLDGLHVLITEDVELNAEILTDLLEMEGITSEWAKNGKLAVDMYAQSDVGHFDLILMDMRMPVMDGLTATREIRKLDRPDAKRIPIIALTANAFEEDMKRCLAAGMDAHLAKPVDIEQLKNEVRKVLARR